MVKLKITDVILQMIGEYEKAGGTLKLYDTRIASETGDTPSNSPQTFEVDDNEKHIEDGQKETATPEFIEHSVLLTMYKDIKLNYADIHRKFPALAFTLRGSCVYIAPKPRLAPKTKEYLELMEQLRANEKELEYQRLINPSYDIEGPAILEMHKPQLTPAQETKAVKEQISTIINIILSVVSVAAAVWQWSGTSSHLDLAVRTLLSLFASIIVLIAEVFIYLRYQIKVLDARETEQKKKETKTVVSSFSFSNVSSVEEIKSSEVSSSSVETNVSSAYERPSTNRDHGTNAEK